MIKITYHGHTIKIQPQEVIITCDDEEFIYRPPADEEKLLAFARRKVDSYIESVEKDADTSHGL